MLRLRRLLVAILISLCLYAAAQTPDTATIHGQAVDQGRAAIPGVEVTATNALSGLRRSVQTDALGKFSLAGLPIAGPYEITAHKEGFAETQLRNVILSGGRTADITLQLKAAGGQTEVTVTGAVGEGRPAQPQLGDHLSAAQMEEMPLPNRRITYLPLLNAANHPAINQGDVFMNQNLFTTNGSGRRQTTFEVDGSTGNDSWGRQTIFTNVPIAAVDEIAVLENAFSAEYGATTGGVVNMVTRSGGSTYHGDLAGVWRPNDTAAKLSGFTANS